MILRHIIFFCIVMSVNSPTQTCVAQAADTVLMHVSELYKSVQNVYLEGKTTVRIRRGRQSKTSEYFVQVAKEAPARYRIEMGGELARLLIANDSTTLAYHPATSQYVLRPEPIETVYQKADFPDVLSTYARLEEIAEHVTLVSSDSNFTVAGKPRRAYFLEIIPRQTPQTRGQSATYEYAIDRETWAVLKERKSMYIPNAAQGTVSMTQVTSYDIVHVSGDIPDSLFAAIPPAGAERVSKIEAFPNIPVSLHGQAVPPFSLPLAHTEGEMAFSDLQGKVVILNFWATWCAPCRAEMGALNQLYSMWKNQGLEVAAINVEELPDVAMAYIEEESFGFPVLLDAFGLVTRQMEVHELPTTFIIDENGIIRHHLVGARTEADFRQYLEPFFAAPLQN